jgi:hypothetical protein
MSTLGQ